MNLKQRKEKKLGRFEFVTPMNGAIAGIENKKQRVWNIS